MSCNDTCERFYVGEVDKEIILESDDQTIDWSDADTLTVYVRLEDGTTYARTGVVGDELYELTYRTIAADIAQAGEVSFQGLGVFPGGAKHRTGIERWPVETPLTV